YLYYIRNSANGEVITNITENDPLGYISKQSANVHVNSRKWDSQYDLNLYQGDIMEMLNGTGYDVYAAVRQPLKPGDEFYEGDINYSRLKAYANYAYPVLITALILLVISAVYLAYVAGRREKGGSIELMTIDGIYTDVHTLLVLVAAVLSVMLAGNSLDPDSMASWIGVFVILGIDGLIGIAYVLSMIRQAKAGSLFRNSLVWSFLRVCFSGRIFKGSAILFLLGYGLINGILFDIGVDLNNGNQEPIFTVLLIVFNIAAVYFAVKALKSLTKVMTAVKELSAGNLDYALDNTGISVAFSDMAGDIENIQSGMKKAVSEAVKGERMKTELITNVSHDLKTPLTSIVNYVDLLKSEELDNEKAQEYVEILEEKAARLKQLVEDLVEASKASSGNLQVNAEKVDLHELVMQAFGEYEERVAEAGLDIRINAEESNIFVKADGRHMWRIIENLLTNTIKYSMPQSRVYVNLKKGSGYGSLTIKNVSASPLDIPPEQLTERFVRGDASRTTEGSGLGLSIAQSLTTLQGGRFKIDIDGDLFKVNVELPLWKE
ncbi:MAG TPA: HAMP domain-containing sensor histidine kinase, partial [Negativicutes bacterium]|nr:HAMP domain-containing sensor histidine kinase [Negativicutes bacterium]